MRLIGKDIALFQVDDDSGFGVDALDFTTTLKEVEFEFTLDMAENRAVKDRAHYNQDIGEDWRATFDIQLTDTAYPSILTFLKAGTTIYLKSQGSSTGTATNLQVEGTGVCRSGRVRYNKGAQVLSVEVVPRGEMTFTGV